MPNNRKYPNGIANVQIPMLNHFSGQGGTIRFDPHVSAGNPKPPANNNIQLPSQAQAVEQIRMQLASFRSKVNGKLQR